MNRERFSRDLSRTRQPGKPVHSLLARRAQTTTRRMDPGLFALVVMAAFIPCHAVQAQVAAPAAPVWTDQMFDQWVFQQDRNAAGARRRLNAFLELRIEEVDRACKLTDAQKKKLQLAGKGDFKRFFDRYQTVKRKFQLVKNDQQKINQIWQDISPLQTSLQAGLFHEDSFLVKALPNTLTADQLARYEAVAHERRAFQHRASIELTIAILEQNMPLRDAQRRELFALLTKYTKPARKSGQYEYYVIMIQLGRVPEEKRKTLFDPAQRRIVSGLLDQYRQMEQWLRKSGQWPEEDDEADKADARPAPVKK
jgi:hypothetical protein